MKYIGIHGPAGVGKTTLAQMLAMQLDGEIIPFAAALKNFAKLLGWNGEKDDKGRKILQLLGTDIGRNLIDKDIWVIHWKGLVEKHQRELRLAGIQNTDNEIVIADDLRFLNEAKIITKYRGTLIKVVGRKIYDDLDDLSKHASEQELPDDLFDYVIDNSGTKDDLFKYMAEIVNGII